ncbi:MAG: S8 family serine peptidase [bacterium]|nr:S8 family serine peptidase [bacterium]
MLPRKFCTISITAVVFLCLLWSFGFVIASTNVQSGVWKGIPVEFRKGEALLVTEDEEIWTDLTTLRTTLSVTTPDSTTGGGYFMIQFPETSNVLNICTQFESANGVIACIPSLRMRKASNDAHFEYQWNMYNDGSLYAETEGHDIMLDEAHAISRGNSDVKLVIIDSGVPWDFDLDQPTHLDLNNDNFPEHITRATEFPEGFINPSDVEGHGTQVAGIALGEADNNYGIAGVCPECNGVVYKVWNSDESDNFLAPTMMGMWRAANLEGEGDDYDDPTVILVPSTLFTQGIEGDLDALRALENLLKDLVYRNHNNQWPDYSTRNLFIFPTGNENLHYVPYPARFASYDRIESGVISVGATNIFDNRWWVNDGIGSNYWGSNVTLSAPGGGATEPGCEPGILSSDIVSSRQHSCYWGLLQGPHSDFLSNKGTSIAAAHVAGLAGLVWSLSPNLTNWQVKNYMVAGVDAIADEMGEGREVGAG